MLHPWVQITKDTKELASAHVDVMTQADHAEILQETEQKTEQEEAVKDQQEQEATSGDTGGKYTKPAVVMELWRMEGQSLKYLCLKLRKVIENYNRFIHTHTPTYTK